MINNVYPLNEQDVLAVAEIEKECFSSPWSQNAIKEELTNPLANFLVFKENDTAVGYIGSHIVCDECSITNVAVLKTFRRQNIASSLIDALITLCREKEVKSIFLEVRKSNTAAQTLYSKKGFTPIGERKNFYTAPAEDAISMKLCLKDG